MKAKHIYSAVLVALMATACTNDDFTANVGTNLQGKKMDASNFTLVGTGSDENAQTRVEQVPAYYANGGWRANRPTWESGDMIGFSHIYSDNQIITNYKFKIVDGIGESTAATFETDNSTIFEGGYFVYYPFNENYADYKGIPFSLDAVQEQDASKEAIVTASMDPNKDEATKNKFLAAGNHLKKFSISNRVEAEPQVNQTEFSLNQYTSQLIFRIYPKNATQDINIKRVELVSATGESLQIPVGVRFKTLDGQTPVVDSKQTEYAEKAVLLFKNVNEKDGGAGGLLVSKDTKYENGVLGYMSMLPATYAADTYKFVVYFTEENTLKKKEITKEGVGLVLESNKPQPVSLEIDVNGAVEVTTDYEIYTETEFVSALTKSNAVSSGSSTFTIMKDITLNDSYSFSSAVPVTFNGGKKITVASGKTLTFDAKGKVVINNTIAGKGSVDVKSGEVEVDGIDGAEMTLTNAGTLTVANASGDGNLLNVTNSGNLTLKKATVATDFKVQGKADAKVDLEDVNVGGTMDFAEAVTAESNLNNVNVKGNVTNNAATLNVKGANIFAYDEATATNSDLTNYATINFVEGATATVGNLINGKSDSKGRINMGVDGSATTVTFNGATNLANGLVYVESKATMITNGKLSGLKGDGTVDAAKSSMVLEGNLTTNGSVSNSKFTFCGKITNNGTWSLSSAKALAKFSHAHSSKASFTNNAGGVVTVSGVTDANAKTAMNAMPKDLYNTRSKGTLIWKGISSMANVDAIYNMGEDCWATQLSADLTIANANSGTEETLSEGVDWSDKDIVLNVLNATGNNAARSYRITLGDEAQIKAKNLTIHAELNKIEASQAMNVEGGVEGAALLVENTLTLSSKTASNRFTLNIENGATCKDLFVNNILNGSTFEIKNGTAITWTNDFKQEGYTENTVYPNGTPQRSK